MTGTKRLNLVWAALIALTLGSYVLSHEAGLSALSAIVLFAISAFKSELVLTNFMEASQAERQWLWLYRLWIAAVATILIIGFAT
jgi:Prokaryotic Cytochrome C oxidase subunit IV